MTEQQEVDQDNTSANIYCQMISLGYSAKHAAELITEREKNKDAIKTVRESIDLAKSFPIELIPDFEKYTQIQQDNILWELGINTKGYAWVIDVCCYNYDGEAQCGKLIVGQERTDKGWTNKVVEGRNVASDEARYYNDRDTLQVMRGNRRD